MPVAGDVDTSFAGNGKKTITFGGVDAAEAVLVQPDSRIVVAGGSGAGKATVDFGVATFAHAVARQPNGRIVVAGRRTVSDDFALPRLLA